MLRIMSRAGTKRQGRSFAVCRRGVLVSVGPNGQAADEIHCARAPILIHCFVADVRRINENA
jgi:hypothetical protein